MSAARIYYVYILASGRYGTLYIGVTNNLRNRLDQHRSGRGSEFVKKYSAGTTEEAPHIADSILSPQ